MPKVNKKIKWQKKIINLGPSRTTVMYSIRSVARALIENLGHIINWPETEEKRRQITAKFADKTKPGIPFIAGCVDGTLIPIYAAATSGGTYRDRYGTNSLNVLGKKIGVGKIGKK